MDYTVVVDSTAIALARWEIFSTALILGILAALTGTLFWIKRSDGGAGGIEIAFLGLTVLLGFFSLVHLFFGFSTSEAIKRAAEKAHKQRGDVQYVRYTVTMGGGSIKKLKAEYPSGDGAEGGGAK